MPSMLPLRSSLAALALLSAAATSSAHLNYNGKDFGVFTGFEPRSFTISGQVTPNASGWADGTDADFGDTHGVTFFKFTLQSTTTVTVTVEEALAGTLLPGFSIYAGLGTTGAFPDYETDITLAYLATLGAPQPREGAFNALATWKMGTELDSDYTNFTDLSTFTYRGNAADGTAANYGAAAGINGDGLADGRVSAAFSLGAGDYTLVIGGANYAAPVAGAVGVKATVSAVPEPSSTLLALGTGSLMLGWWRRRRRS